MWVTTQPDWKGFVNHGTAYAWELDEFFTIRQNDYYISSQANERFFEEGIGNIKDDLPGWLSNNIKKLASVSYYSFFQELRPSEDGRTLVSEHPGLLRVMHVGTLAFIFLTLYGVIRSLGRLESVILVVVIGYFFLLGFVFFAEARFFLPIVPLYLVFSAVPLFLLANTVGQMFSWVLRSITQQGP